MSRKINEKLVKITENIAFRVIDDVIYLFLEDYCIKREDLNKIYQKLATFLASEDISAVNLSGKKIKENKEYYQSLGFTIKSYTIDKINNLYARKKDREPYRYYAFISKEEFIKIASNKEKHLVKGISNSGYISSMLLLIWGIAMLSFFCIQGAIYMLG